MESLCDQFSLERVLERCELVETSACLVGTRTVHTLHVGDDLRAESFIRTFCRGELMKLEQAQGVSAAHRAFRFDLLEGDTRALRVTFQPSGESVSRAPPGDRMVVELRLVRAVGALCCFRPQHAEVARYYVSGRYERLQLTAVPDPVCFGEVEVGGEGARHVTFTNRGHALPVRVQHVLLVGYEVSPREFVLHPQCSKRLTITAKPTSLNFKMVLHFKIRNPRDGLWDVTFDPSSPDDDNYLLHKIKCVVSVKLKKEPKMVAMESLHKLWEVDPRVTYLSDELAAHETRRDLALQHLRSHKHATIKSQVDKLTKDKERCELITEIQTRKPRYLCKPVKLTIGIEDLFDLTLEPVVMDFGRIGLHTYGEKTVCIKNNSRYVVKVNFLRDECVVYSENKLSTMSFKLKPFSDTSVLVYCLGFIEGRYSGTFEYKIDDKFLRKHPYSLQVGNPTLMVKERSLKFGMVTSEGFITSVPVRIYNYFNTPVRYSWGEIPAETPFKVVPTTGTVPGHDFRSCDMMYVCKSTKAKVFEIDFISEGKTIKIIPIELCIATRKLSVKFLEQAVLFKDIPLNLEVIEYVNLENSSREIATFHTADPILPGITAEPMSGTLQPKSIIVFKIVLKISYVLEFSTEIYFKINNKETVVLPISGNVVEPRVVIRPRNIVLRPIPCNMIAYVPVTLQNKSTARAVVDVGPWGRGLVGAGRFAVCESRTGDKQPATQLVLDGGQTKTVYIKVCDDIRREYEMFIPFQINRILGPPNADPASIEQQYYLGEHRQQYEDNPKIKIKSLDRDIAYCRISGVITLPWIEFSVDQFEIEYVPQGQNLLEFSMINVTTCDLYVAIDTGKLSPNFTLNMTTSEHQSIINETNMKFVLEPDKLAQFTLMFHPKGHGRFVVVPPLFLDKQMTIAYHNLVFVGKRQAPPMTASISRVIFPPVAIGEEIARNITMDIEGQHDISSFSCLYTEEPNLTVTIVEAEIVPTPTGTITVTKVDLTVCSKECCSRTLWLSFEHASGAGCEVEVSFCVTACPLTLHAQAHVHHGENPYPYYPLESQTELYDYMERCRKFLEKWMYQQGFHRDLYPYIPDTFDAISSALSSPPSGRSSKTKGINVSYLNFLKRAAGPLMKHIRKITATGLDESLKHVKEIHDTYREVVGLVRARGGAPWGLQPCALLSHHQLREYAGTANTLTHYTREQALTRDLLADDQAFQRLHRQSWFDLVLQTYRAFVLDSCLLECACEDGAGGRDVPRALLRWYGEHVTAARMHLRRRPPRLDTLADLADGVAIASVLLDYCPFLERHLSQLCDVDEGAPEEGIIHNASLIVEAFGVIRLNFPIECGDFLKPNFVQMLFLSVHLYVALPTFEPRDMIRFNPPLSSSSTRRVSVTPADGAESLAYNFFLINNGRNSFSAERALCAETGKMSLDVKYVANFVSSDEAVLIVQGYNKSRLYDTYAAFVLRGAAGALPPHIRCRVTAPLYRHSCVDVPIESPFAAAATYRVSLVDTEPTLPVRWDTEVAATARARFLVRRLNLVDREVTLAGSDADGAGQAARQRLYLTCVCLWAGPESAWLWLRGAPGEFLVRVTAYARTDLPLDTLTAVPAVRAEPCSCGAMCACYRTAAVWVPHRNDAARRALRAALQEHASDSMLQLFDRLIERCAGRAVLRLLLAEGGSDVSALEHLLAEEVHVRVTGRGVEVRGGDADVTLSPHSPQLLPLAVTLPPALRRRRTTDRSGAAVLLSSACGRDLRVYRVIFTTTDDEDTVTSSSHPPTT